MPAAPPFTELAAFLPSRPPLREAITAARRRPEPRCIAELLPLATLAPGDDDVVRVLARRLAQGLRSGPSAVNRENMVQGLLQEFSLASDEGVALMCLAEALLRIPDAATRDALIRDKIGRGDWRAHVGRSSSPFVNAAAWGLLVTGKLVATHDEGNLSGALTRITARFGEPVIRKAVDLGMRLMGRQFVAGETIAQALDNARRHEAQGFRYSYDMLGEAAMTDEDARRYLTAYEEAIDAIGAASGGRDVIDGPGISIKLSALHPRYSFAQGERVMDELYPRLRDLVLRARRFDIGINIDAEESDRLEPSLDLLERLCEEPELAGWNGVGFVAQAYQKRCPMVIDALVDLARRTGRRLMVRLVKGAYWDSEIKRAQVEGLDDYPVFTRKVHTDVSYLACARKLLAAPEHVYPQFATHNAQTLASIHRMAGAWQPGQYEFQCLHGMGEPLYAQVVRPQAEGGMDRPCRIYAPVGTHETLLAYLVRRLLENGANTSFINRIADPRVSLDDLVESPVQVVMRTGTSEGGAGKPHPRIRLPREIFAGVRANSRGVDFTDESVVRELLPALQERGDWVAGAGGDNARLAIANPADPSDVVGHVSEANAEDVAQALARAQSAFPGWAALAGEARGRMLERAADALEGEMPRLLGLIVREAGKTLPNAVGEVREAVDFLRYYGRQARERLRAETHVPLGIVGCISPWNFPLAIFTGQVAAALAAGNCVLAKPAEQTPLIAAEAIRILHAAGVPEHVVQLLPGRGEIVGAAIVGDARVQAIVFTGSTEVARLIQRVVATRLDARDRPVTLIAETGGQNAMIVDSSALAEQVVADALVSAFDSAGQRCSALRLLCVQEEIADRVLGMLRGALQELLVGGPESLAVDVGPVIDAAARDNLVRHIAQMKQAGRRVEQGGRAQPPSGGTFVPPTIIELERLEELTQEVFGPVLHVLRYRRDELDALVERINALGYGLTLGVHSRVEDHIAAVASQARVGNIYVNRNIVGAVVGVQPFGGEGLSGTGPKAGGPLYLDRLLARSPVDAVLSEMRALDAVAVGGPGTRPALHALSQLRGWSGASGALRAQCGTLADITPLGDAVVLPGPTGERNTYAVLPRERVLCLAERDEDRLAQLALVMAVGARAVWPTTASALRARLPDAVREHVIEVRDWRSTEARFDAVLHHGSREERVQVSQHLAQRHGPITALLAFDPGEVPLAVGRLLVERVVSVNTAAAGGNASLMAVG